MSGSITDESLGHFVWSYLGGSTSLMTPLDRHVSCCQQLDVASLDGKLASWLPYTWSQNLGFKAPQYASGAQRWQGWHQGSCYVVTLKGDSNCEHTQLDCCPGCILAGQAHVDCNHQWKVQNCLHSNRQNSNWKACFQTEDLS